MFVCLAGCNEPFLVNSNSKEQMQILNEHSISPNIWFLNVFGNI
jgi:hypothetical protein